MKFQFLPENFSRSENAPPFETRKIRHFEVERIFLKNKKMVEDFERTLYSYQNSIFYLETGSKLHTGQNGQSIFQNRQKISFSAHVRRRLDCSASSYSVISVKKPIRSGNIIIGFEQFYRPVPEEVT